MSSPYLIVRCNNSTQFNKYETLTTKLNVANDNEIFEVTGCLSNCHKYKYTAKPLGPVKRTPPRYSGLGLSLIFYYPATEHEVREQVHKRITLNSNG